MACENKIVKNITSNCATQPIAGIEQTVYIFNRNDLDTTTEGSNGLLTGITLDAGTTAFTLKGLKKNLSAGFERVVAEDAADTFMHKLTFHGYEFDSASIENIDRMTDLVAVVERKDKQNSDGVFVVYGLQTGLYITSDTMTTNDVNGVRVIEMSTMEGWGEKKSQYNLLDTDYATTKALLEALL